MPENRTLARQHAVQAVASESGVVTGIVLYSPTGNLKLVPLNAGERVLHSIVLSTQALEDMGLTGYGAYVDFLKRIRLAPTETVHGTFVVTDADSAPRIVSAANLRQATAEEISAAITADIKQSLAKLRAANVVPVMSAQELTELMRGDDEETQPSPAR